MPSRFLYSLVTSLLVTAACAYQNAGAGTDDDGEDRTDEGGSSSGGTSPTAGKSTLPIAGSLSPGMAGTSTTTGGKSSGGSGGKGGSGGSGGKGGSAGSAGSAMGAGGEDPDPVNMPLVGLSLTFAPENSADLVDFLGGELHLLNDTAQPLSLSDIKIRYYFGNEITSVTPAVMMNWAQFGPTNNLGGATCTGAIAAAASPKPGADSYVELTCSGASASELTAGTMLKVSWKAGAQGTQNKFIQSDDWSFGGPTKIIVLNGSTIVWGVDPS
jgi:endoglucanase